MDIDTIPVTDNQNSNFKFESEMDQFDSPLAHTIYLAYHFKRSFAPHTWLAQIET